MREITDLLEEEEEKSESAAWRGRKVLHHLDISFALKRCLIIRLVSSPIRGTTELQHELILRWQSRKYYTVDNSYWKDG